MTTSKIKDHKVRNGKVISPWNYSLGKTMAFSSWAYSRLPEYIWLCLIHDHYGREEGLRRSATILNQISAFEKSLDKPKLSKILALPVKTQEEIYRVITKNIRKEVLAPLTAILSAEVNGTFSSAFYVDKLSMEVRLQKIKAVMTKYFPHQSNDATDIRYLVLLNLVYQEKIVFSTEVKDTVQALKEYPYTSHDDEKMRSYRPMVRASEIGPDETNGEFIDRFWKGISMKTDCELFYINHDKPELIDRQLLEDISEVLEFTHFKNKEDWWASKYTVFMSLVVYSYKVYCEVVDKEIGNTIAARSSIRMMIEIFIMLKYLDKMSSEKPNIWQEYQQYGIGKYKLILLKAREFGVENDSHLKPELLELWVNEDVWEEFIDTDLRYFDQMNIREKSIYVGEKDLFDLLYDYDSNYSHGLWGAIRESAIVKCNNAGHKFHIIPDLMMKQNCTDVLPDMNKMMKRTMLLLNDAYPLPEWYLEKHYA